MRYGKFLPKGGTIGFVAPSFGCNIEPYRTAFENAKRVWTAQGYQLRLGPNVYEGLGIGISNTPKKCAEEFQDWYAREDVDVLISCGGGELMCEILPYIDFGKVAAQPPKWFMGFSDNTNLTFLLATLADTAAVYGPCAAAFGMEPPHESLHDAMGILTGETCEAHNYPKWEREGGKTEEEPLLPYHVTEDFALRVYDPASEACLVRGEDFSGEIALEGRLLGGCLDSLATLCGTRFDAVRTFNERYAEDGVLWFLEACDLNVMDIRRALWQLGEAGWFENAKGFLIGRPLCYGEEMLGLDQYTAVVGALAKYHVPIIMDLDIGHLPPMMPLVCGSKARARVKGNAIRVEMKFV